MTIFRGLQVASPPARRRQPHTIAIASGKGGVGKTWLTITLGHALAKAGRRVLLFDGDLGLANIDVQLGLTAKGDLGDVVSGRSQFEDVIHPHEGGFDIIAGRSGSGVMSSIGPVVLEEMLAMLRRSTYDYDVVLLDLGGGLERSVRRMSIFADTLFVVATEDPTSLTDAYTVLKIYRSDLGDENRHAKIVINLAESASAGQRTYCVLRKASERFLGQSPSCAGVIRRDGKVLEMIRRQSLLLSRYPACVAASDVEAMASRLL